MNITLTVRGNLEDDATLQEILAILYKRNAPETQTTETRATVEASTGKQDNTYPISDVEVITGEQAPCFSSPAAQSEPEPKPKAVSFEVVTAAARKALNDGKRVEVAAIFTNHGAATLKDIPETEYAAVLAEIEAL